MYVTINHLKLQGSEVFPCAMHLQNSANIHNFSRFMHSVYVLRVNNLLCASCSCTGTIFRKKVPQLTPPTIDSILVIMILNQLPRNFSWNDKSIATWSGYRYLLLQRLCLMCFFIIIRNSVYSEVTIDASTMSLC